MSWAKISYQSAKITLQYNFKKRPGCNQPNYDHLYAVPKDAMIVMIIIIIIMIIIIIVIIVAIVIIVTAWGPLRPPPGTKATNIYIYIYIYI